MSKSGSESPEFPDAVISDDSKDSFQLSKSSRKSQKRLYRRHQPSVGDSNDTKKESGIEKRREKPGYDEKRRRHATERYHEGRERSRELYDKERRNRDSRRDHLTVSKRRDERLYDTRHLSHSPQHDSQSTGRYKSRDHSARSHDKVSRVTTEHRKRRKEDYEAHVKGRQVSRVRDSESDSDGEIKPPLRKKRIEPKNVNVASLVEDLKTHLSSESSESDSMLDTKESGSSCSPEVSDAKKAAVSPTQPVTTWRDIAEESSESETEHNLEKGNDSDAKFSQMSENFLKYSGMQSVSSSEMDEPDKEPANASSPTTTTTTTTTTAVTTETTAEKVDEQMDKDNEPPVVTEEEIEAKPQLPPYLPALMGCRSVESYEWLNRIEEGTYGVVFRGKDRKTGQVVALKKLKMEKEREGFPITSLREINMLLKSSHPNIVHVREIVVGSNMDKIYIVMDYVEHDLKSLMEVMKQPFLEGEVKTLMIQLLKAVHHLHDNWILHRDLKTSNLLLSHKGILKVADFGLAREYGSPLKHYTPVVVTLWYRCPELLLGAKEYSTAVDVWSVGCIFAELLQHKPLFMGKSEIDQLNQIFKELGTPSEDIWPGYGELPVAKKVNFTKQPLNNLRKRFPMITNAGFNLLNKFLTYDPKRRITAEEGCNHPFFEESPKPVDPSMFPTWPAKSEMVKKQNRQRSPSAPEGGAFLLNQVKEKDEAVGAGFTLKF